MNVRETLENALKDRYTIERAIGAGGMATVYLARDIRHDRQVALKVLKPELGAVLGVERFLAEIRVTANLQHPHLLPLFDSGEAAGLLFYVMPFVAGESLRQRLEREQQLSIPEAVRIATAVASALDYAHRHNVVHRDLKPENILMQDGEPVVSDFGIALAVSNAGGARITQTGLSLGTPAYMSPEQAGGDRVVDARSDVYSLGAVLYEMLIGEPPHTGVNVQQVISRVLTERPRSLTEQRHTIPHWLEDGVLRSLAKLPADRFPTARAFGDALKSGDTRPLVATGAKRAVVAPPPRLWLPWTVAGVAAAVAAFLAFRPEPRVITPPLVRFSVAPPQGLRSEFVDMAMAADGRRLLLIEGPPGSRKVWMRRLSDDDLTEVPGLGDAQHLFLSPDGNSVGFVSDGRLRTMSVNGGPVTTLGDVADVPTGDSPSWGSRGLIAFRTFRSNALWGVPVGGGARRQLTTPDSSEVDRQPSFLPDGEHFLFVRHRRDSTSGARPTPDTAPGGAPPGAPPGGIGGGPSGRGMPFGDATLMLGKVGSDARPLGTLRGSAPQYVDGYLVYATDDGTIHGVALDDALRPVGVSVAFLTIPSGSSRGPRGARFVASHTGALAFLEAAPRQVEVVAVDRNGRSRALTGTPREYGAPVVSATGMVAVEVTDSEGATDIYTYDANGAARRVTRGGRHRTPVWSADGRTLAWVRSEAGDRSEVTVQRMDVADSARVVFAARGMIRLHGFSPSGDSLRGVLLAQGTHPDLFAASLTDGGVAHYHSEDGERSASVSPNGRWVTYTASEDGVTQVFVRPASTAGPVVRVSDGGGELPHWGTGNTLLYRDSSSVVEVRLDAGTVPRVAGRATLFPDAFERAMSSWDVAPDGTLVMLQAATERAHVDMLVNVTALVRARAATARRGAD